MTGWTTPRDLGVNPSPEINYYYFITLFYTKTQDYLQAYNFPKYKNISRYFLKILQAYNFSKYKNISRYFVFRKIEKKNPKDLHWTFCAVRLDIV